MRLHPLFLVALMAIFHHYCVVSAFSSPTTTRTAVKRGRSDIVRSQCKPQRPRQRGLTLSNSSDNANLQRPELVSSKSATTQKLVFVASFAALALGTFGCIQLWYGPAQSLLGTDYFLFVCQKLFPIGFGTIFAAVGVAHFVFVENFARIVPPKGTWGGLWQVPAPFSEQLGIEYADYQSYLSGVFEFIGGLWLLAGGLGYTDPSLPGLLLFLLTVAVTPANLYMFTHDASPGGAVPPLSYPDDHIARFLIQCGLLSNFWIVSHPPL